MSEHEDGEWSSGALALREALKDIHTRNCLDGGIMEVRDADTGELVMTRMISVASDDKTADNSVIVNTVSVSASASGTSFSNGSENPSDPFVAAYFATGDEVREILAQYGAETGFKTGRLQLNPGDIVDNVKIFDFDPFNPTSSRFDASDFTFPEFNPISSRFEASGFTFPEFKPENSVDPEQIDSMPFLNCKFVFRGASTTKPAHTPEEEATFNNRRFVFGGASTTESAPTPEEEAPSKSVFDRAAHGLPATLPSYTDADEEVMRNKIEFMLSNLDIESQTEMIKNIFLHYVKRREACLTMSANHRDIHDDIVKPALGEAVFPDSFKNIFANIDGIFKNMDTAAQKNRRNWADACEVTRDLFNGTEDHRDAIVEEAQADGTENLFVPVIDDDLQLKPNNTKIPRVIIPGRRRIDPPIRVAYEVVVERGSNEIKDADLASLQTPVAQSNDEASNSGISKRGGKKGKKGKKGKGKGKKQ